jgi:hypothetical protein
MGGTEPDVESQKSAGNELSPIEQRLRRLEDIEEIKKLKARYCAPAAQ